MSLQPPCGLAQVRKVVDGLRGVVGCGFVGDTVVSSVLGSLIVSHGPTVHLKLHVFAFAGHFKVHLPPVQLALQCSPLQSISHPPPVHDKSQVFAVHRMGLQFPLVQVRLHLSVEWQVIGQLPPVQVTFQSSPLQFITQPPPVHDKSQVFESHRIDLQFPPVQLMSHLSDA